MIVCPTKHGYEEYDLEIDQEILDHLNIELERKDFIVESPVSKLLVKKTFKLFTLYKSG